MAVQTRRTLARELLPVTVNVGTRNVISPPYVIRVTPWPAGNFRTNVVPPYWGLRVGKRDPLDIVPSCQDGMAAERCRRRKREMQWVVDECLHHSSSSRHTQLKPLHEFESVVIGWVPSREAVQATPPSQVVRSHQPSARKAIYPSYGRVANSIAAYDSSTKCGKPQAPSATLVKAKWRYRTRGRCDSARARRGAGRLRGGGWWGRPGGFRGVRRGVRREKTRRVSTVGRRGFLSLRGW